MLPSAAATPAVRYLQLAIAQRWAGDPALAHLEPVVSAEALPGFSPKVSQQQNDCDCGVYVLQFVEAFIRAPPCIDARFIQVAAAGPRKAGR